VWVAPFFLLSKCAVRNILIFRGDRVAPFDLIVDSVVHDQCRETAVSLCTLEFG